MEKLDVKKMSVQDVVKALEDRSISSAEIDKNILKECVVVMKNWGYHNSEIGSLLKISDRSVQRYVSDVRESNALSTTADFQKHFMAETISNFRTQYYRLIRMSHLENTTVLEKTRAIFAACQIMKDVIVILERLGYASLENTLKLRKEEERLIRLDKEQMERESSEDYKALTVDQRKEIVDHFNQQFKHLMELSEKWIHDTAVDNKKKGIKGEPIEKPVLVNTTVVLDSNKKT